MAIRFPERPGPTSGAPGPGSRGLFGDWWAAIAVVGIVGMAVLMLAGGAAPPPPSPSARLDPTADVLAALAPAERSLAAVERALEQLCREPVLLALELEPDCETGAMTFGDDYFGEFGDSEVRPAVQEEVAAALTNYLARLRQLPALWESLEAIEIRGHTDPRALRDPYTTNLVGSQQRALGLLLFLLGPKGLSESDQEDLKRLVTVSGASFSRPPATCPEDTRECYPDWRRVEVLPVLSEPLRRGDWARTVEAVRVAAQGRERRNESASEP
jgi:outer membrane protein OmpA-like peptidoglycan-associated protein